MLVQLMNFFQNLLTNKTKNKNRKKVFVGISGGVDSAVSAILLKEQGYEVTGVFIRTWQPDFIECTWRDERRDAIRICAHIGIPFMEIDAESTYRDLVGMQMVNDYKNGLTPNPDILCNREVKFGVFWDFAKSLGADYIATGHYAKNYKDKKTGDYFLAKPKDHKKDQTYFLWTLKNDDLEHVIFPLSNIEKSEVRRIAKKHNLPNATKKDSQGVCFLGHIDIKDFISHYTKLEKGNVLDTQGNIVGQHDGAIVYTLGQRHGFNIEKKTNSEKPFYVVDRNSKNNTITVSNNPNDILYAKDSFLINSGFMRSCLDGVTAMYRYNGEHVPVKSITNTNTGDTLIEFNKKIMISPGQSIVFYKQDLVVGGGICIK